MSARVSFWPWLLLVSVWLVPPPLRPIEPAGEVALAAFLAVGLAIAVAVAAVLNDPRGYWLSLMIVGRGLAPFEGHRRLSLIYGLGALAGVAFAMGIQAIGLPGVANLALAVLATVIAVRMLTSPLPITAACLTFAALLLTTDSFGQMLFRAQVVAIVVVTAVLLSLLIEAAWRWVRLETVFSWTPRCSAAQRDV